VEIVLKLSCLQEEIMIQEDPIKIKKEKLEKEADQRK